MFFFLIHLKLKALTIAMRPDSTGKQQTKDTDPILLTAKTYGSISKRVPGQQQTVATAIEKVTSYKLP